MPGSVARLCSDVLSFIARYAVEDDTAATHSQYVFSHVCREWRFVALSDSTLWTTPTFDKPKMAVSMIERSRRLPITVRLSHRDLGHWDLSDLVDALTKSAGIQHLTFSADFLLLEELLERLERLPVLESLDLTQLYNPGLNSCILASRILQEEQLPRLRKFSLSHCLIRWDAKCLTNLTHLTIDLTDEEPRFHGLFATLGRCPTLVYLELRDIFPMGELDLELQSDLIDIPPRYVLLPNLRQLLVENDLLWIHYFLLALRTPQLSHLELNASVTGDIVDDLFDEGMGPVDPDFRQLCEHLNDALNAIGVSITTIDADGENYSASDYRINRSSLTITCGGRKTEAAKAEELQLILTLDKVQPYSARYPEEDLAVFLQTVRTDCLESVSFTLDGDSLHIGDINSICVWKALSSIPALKRVVLTGNDVDAIPDDILKPLQGSLPVHDSVTNGQYFSSLEYLKYGTSSRGCLSPESVVQSAGRIALAVTRRARVAAMPGLTIELSLDTNTKAGFKPTKIEVSGSGVRITWP